MRRRCLPLFAIIWTPLLLWWAALLPGGMSNDSLDSWAQIQGAHWTSHHPPPFTAFFWLTSLGGTTPATTSLAETLIVAAALTFFAAVLSHVLDAGRAVYVAAVALGVLPLVGPFSVTIWKDVPETAVLLALAGLLVLGVHVVAPLPRRWWVAVASCAFAAGLLRWNGGATALVAAVVAAIALRGRRRWWAALATAGAGLAGSGVLLLIPHIAPVTPVQPIDSQAEQLADLAQFVRNTPHALSAHDRAVLRSIAPLPEWRRAGYTCVTIDVVTFFLIRYGGHEDAVNAHTSDLSHVWRRLAKKEPGELLHARVCRASLAWSFGDPPRREIPTVHPHVTANRFGLHQLSPAPIRNAARSYAGLSNDRWFQVMFWRPAVWLLLAVAAAALAGLRRGRWRLLLASLATPLGVLVSYAAQPAAQDARYTYAATVACQLVVVGYLSAWARSRRRPPPALPADSFVEEGA